MTTKKAESKKEKVTAEVLNAISDRIDKLEQDLKMAREEAKHAEKKLRDMKKADVDTSGGRQARKDCADAQHRLLVLQRDLKDVR